MGINMDDVFAKLGRATQGVEDDMTKFMDTMDSSNSTDLMELQRFMQKWTIATQVQSNTLKTLGEGIKSTVQNIR